MLIYATIICSTVICYFLLFLGYRDMKREAAPVNNIIFGVTVPEKYIHHKSITSACDIFVKQLKNTCIPLLFTPLLMLCIPWFSVCFTVSVLWLVLTMFLPLALYLRYHLHIKTMKYRNGWFEEGSTPTMGDLKALEIIRAPNSILRFVIPIIASFIPFIMQIFRGYGSRDYIANLCCLFVIGLITLLFLAFNAVVQKNRTEMVSTDRKLNRAFSHIQFHNWSSAFLRNALINAAYTWITWLFIRRFHITYPIFLFCTLLYALLLVLSLFWAEYKTRRLQQKLFIESGSHPDEQDDVHWIHGMFYHNHQDRRTLVKRRIRTGYALNLSKPLGKLCGVLLIAIFLLLPVSCIGLFFEEFTPPSMDVTKDHVVLEHLQSVEYIPAGDITGLEYISELTGVKKISGLTFTKFYKGIFQLKDYGKCIFYLNPTLDGFIVIHTEHGTYVINDYSQDETKQLYQKISNIL